MTKPEICFAISDFYPIHGPNITHGLEQGINDKTRNLFAISGFCPMHGLHITHGLEQLPDFFKKIGE